MVIEAVQLGPAINACRLRVYPIFMSALCPGKVVLDLDAPNFCQSKRVRSGFFETLEFPL